MLQPSVPAWFEIPARDMDRAVRFYEAVLEASLVRAGEATCRRSCSRATRSRRSWSGCA